MNRFKNKEFHSVTLVLPLIISFFLGIGHAQAPEIPVGNYDGAVSSSVGLSAGL